jgi:RimJ/RimL family protein N-acetyltransferase
MPGPAYRVETERLVIRCWNPADAPALAEAVGESLPNLATWMPLFAAQEPLTLDARVELLRGFRATFDRGEDFIYGVFSPDEKQVLGGSGLHTRAGKDAREIGYWIRSSHLRQGYATEITAGLTKVAFEIDRIYRVELHVWTANEPSAGVPRKLGFVEEMILKDRVGPSGRGPRRDWRIFTMTEGQYPASECAKAEVAAYDAAGRKLL